MNIKHQFMQYLAENRKKQSYIDECADFADHLNAVFDAKPTAAEGITAFINRIRPRGLVVVKTAYLFLDEYARFAEVGQPLLAESIRLGCRQIFEQTAKDEVRRRKQSILPIPMDARIDPQYLGELTNEQFVAVFGDFQQLVIACYDDIETAPFVWGYPDFYSTGGYYNRVNDILFALAFCGKYRNGALIVNAVKFFGYTGVKRHKKLELVVSGLERFGFVFESFNKKSSEFSVSYPKNPYIISALYAYASAIDEKEKQDWKYGVAVNGFSYRYIEDASTQTHERVFLARMDYASEALRNIQIWLHAEAAKYGYTIDPEEPEEKGCMLYKKGSKRWLLVGQRSDGSVFSKAIFREAHIHTTMAALYSKFPDTFKSNCTLCGGNKSPDVKCSMRIEFIVDDKARRCCAYLSFVFNNLMLDDVKMIMELFKLENKIR